jgi:FkbM family methyltransferase
MTFIDRDGNPANVEYEAEEQFLVRTYIPKDAKVLELGARYGTVSCVLSDVLDDPTQHVAVEPDSSVIEALTKNRDVNGGKFKIFEGVVSKKGYELAFIDPKFDLHEYGTYTKETDTPTIKNMSLKELSDTYNVTFDCIVADCEGFFCDFVDENPEAVKDMRVIIYEQDGIPWHKFMEKYNTLDETLTTFGFSRIHTIPHPKYENNPHFHNVWVKDSK